MGFMVATNPQPNPNLHPNPNPHPNPHPTPTPNPHPHPTLGRLESEVGAATSIQSAFRGYATRPHAESVVTMKDIRREKAQKGAYPALPYPALPYRTVPYRTVPYCAVGYRTVPYRTVLCRGVPYRTGMPCCTICCTHNPLYGLSVVRTVQIVRTTDSPSRTRTHTHSYTHSRTHTYTHTHTHTHTVRLATGTIGLAVPLLHFPFYADTSFYYCYSYDDVTTNIEGLLPSLPSLPSQRRRHSW